MWLGCQSSRFNCLFWRETRQRILGHEISPYPEVGRGRERGSWRGTRQMAVGGWTAERQAAESWRGTTDRGSQHRTPEQRGEAAWDRVQREWVKMSLIPVALVHIWFHASVSPYMLSGMQSVAYLPLLLVNPKLCSCLFGCPSIFSVPSIVFLCR